MGRKAKTGARGQSGRTLKVGHEGLGTAVQGIDDHFTISGTRNFDAAILQTRRRWGAHPGRVSADVCGLRREVELFPRVEALLDSIARVEELQTTRRTA